MRSALFISRLIGLLLLSACMALTQATTSTRKKPAAIPAATKRPVTLAKTAHVASPAARHTRAAVAAHNDNGSARVTSRKVVVTRKLVHGRWVRTTQVVHAPPPGPSYQTHPDTDRYQQIQQALAQKGYFKGEANGTWGDDSVAALKQFQTESKIPNDGKISSLSLIGLGLGPNRESASEKPEPAAPVASADQPNP